MFLTSPLDDTNFTSLRRSIIIYASLIIFVWYYDLSIDLDRLPGGFIVSEEQINISGWAIVSFSAVVQAYLIIRLGFGTSIHLAKVNKA